MNEDDTIYELYSVCPDFSNTETDKAYKFISLDKKIFKNVMSGKITINEVIEEHGQKKLTKI